MFRRMNQNSSETKENIDAVEKEREKRQINLKFIYIFNRLYRYVTQKEIEHSCRVK